jgi:DNA polymerase III delta prime subunit
MRFLLLFLLCFSGFCEEAKEQSGLSENNLSDDEKSLTVLESFEKRVSKIEGDLKSLTSAKSLINNYSEISQDWREAYKLQKEGIDAVFSDEYLKKRKSKLLSRIENVFYRVSKKRSDIIKDLYDNDQSYLIDFESQFFFDLILEVQSIPLRWISLFKSRITKIFDEISRGFKGWLNLFYELLSVLVVFFLGFIFLKIFKRLSVYLDSRRDFYARKSFRDQKAGIYSKWLGRVSPLLPWCWIVIFFAVSESVIQNGYFRETVILFPYFTYYAYYRIFRLIVGQVLSSYSFYRYDRSFKIKKEKLDWTSKFLGRVFLTVLILLHTFRSAGGEGFLYIWIASFSQWFLIFIVFYVSYKWIEEIKLVAQKTFNGVILQTINKCLESSLCLFVAFPVLILEFIFHSAFWIYTHLERFDFIRKISAQYFRSKVDANKVQEQSLNHSQDFSYVKAFLRGQKEIGYKLLKSQKKIFDEIIKKTNLWIEGESDEHIALIYGEKGVGKTTLMKGILQSLNNEDQQNCHYFHLKNDLSSEHTLMSSLETMRESSSKTFVFVDGLQYLFLSKRGGFTRFKDFLKFLQEDRLKNVFWCICINNYSWEFIEAVLQKNRYFNFIFRLNNWSEEEIEEYLLSIHQKTEFKLNFDDVLYSANRTDLESVDFDIEGRYFRILWEESLGNPAVAMRLWLDSSMKLAEKSIKVLIPKDREDFLGGLPDDFYFILASIVKHESLTVKEIEDSTDLGEDIVRNAVKICIEKGYLNKLKNHKVALDSLWQHSIYSTLRRKNFIHG